MRRHTGPVIAALLLLVTIAPVGVTAAPRTADLAPAVRLNHAGACELVGSSQKVIGSTNSSPNVERSGAKARIDIPPVAVEGWRECQGNNLLDSIGPSAYVAIQPRGATHGLDENNGTEGRGLFAGVILCDRYFPPVSYCEALGSHIVHAFVAVNACSITQVVDIYDNFGTGAHDFAIYLNTDQRWHFSIDGSEVYSVANSSLCWEDDLPMAAYGGAGWDASDSFGHGGIAEATITNAYFGLYGQGWQSGVFAGGSASCVWHGSASQPNDTCDVTGTQSLRFFSD